MPPDEAFDRLRLGDWEAHRTSGELRLPSGTERLEPRVMDLLFLLGERPGEVFAREEILARLWPDVAVTEDALARTVFKLRKALGDDAKTPRYIETLPKRGYRLIPAQRIPRWIRFHLCRPARGIGGFWPGELPRSWRF